MGLNLHRARAHAPALLLSAAAVLLLLFERNYRVLLNDYGTEAHASYAALLGGHVSRALQQAPVYGGSLELRAPFALLGSVWSDGALSVYRAAALPCLLAGAGLGLWLCARWLERAARARAAGMLLILAVCTLNPLSFRAMQTGHPEEILGAVLCIAAVILAGRGRAVWAGVVLGLAVANKEWALLAAGPVLIALPTGRVRALLAAGAVAGLLEAPLVLSWGGAAAGNVAVSDAPGAIFHPQQLWWFAGSSGHIVHALDGTVEPGYRTAPAWLGGIAHPLIIWLAVPLTLACTRLERARANPHAPLLLLALLLLLRCLLDPWDVAYYALPFALALLSWEVLARPGRLPLAAPLASCFVWLTFGPLTSAGLSYDAQALVFVLPACAAAVALARALLAGDQHAAAAPHSRPRRVAFS